LKASCATNASTLTFTNTAGTTTDGVLTRLQNNAAIFLNTTSDMVNGASYSLDTNVAANSTYLFQFASGLNTGTMRMATLTVLSRVISGSCHYWVQGISQRN
jgi:hypothetical protein